MGLFLTLIVVETYALFETNASADSELEIGDWKIYLNGVDTALTQTVTISNFTYSSSQHIQSGYLAPGSTASFNVTIDASRTDVSTEYTLTIDDSPIEDYPNIYFSILNLDTNETVVSNTYTGVIALSDQSRTARLSVIITWADQTQYDETDTELINATMAFTIDANFKQYVGNTSGASGASNASSSA